MTKKKKKKKPKRKRLNGKWTWYNISWTICLSCNSTFICNRKKSLLFHTLLVHRLTMKYDEWKLLSQMWIVITYFTTYRVMEIKKKHTIFIKYNKNYSMRPNLRKSCGAIMKIFSSKFQWSVDKTMNLCDQLPPSQDYSLCIGNCF